MLAIIHSLLWMRHWVQLNRSHAPLLAERVAIVSLQQVAVILASNVGLVFSGCCATAGVFFFFSYGGTAILCPQCFCWQVSITCLV